MKRNWKKWMATACALGVLTSVCVSKTVNAAVETAPDVSNQSRSRQGVVLAEQKAGWKKSGNSWYYYTSDGQMAKKWKKIGKNWYFFGTNGVMRTKWAKSGKTWYYFGTDGIMRTKWQKLGKTWYYFGSDGAMRNNWKKIGKTWYYFADGAMKTGWLKNGGNWYYLGTDGAMVTGTRKINGISYRFNSSGECTNPNEGILSFRSVFDYDVDLDYGVMSQGSISGNGSMRIYRDGTMWYRFNGQTYYGKFSSLRKTTTKKRPSVSYADVTVYSMVLTEISDGSPILEKGKTYYYYKEEGSHYSLTELLDENQNSTGFSFGAGMI